MKRSKWDQRIERAEALAEKHPFAGEVLRFYKEVASLQRKLDSSFEEIFGKAFDASSNPLLDPDLSLHPLLPEFGEFLSHIEAIAPGPIRTSASKLRSQGSPRWLDLLTASWRSSPDFQAPQATEKRCWHRCSCNHSPSFLQTAAHRSLAAKPWQSVRFATDVHLSAC